MITYTEISKAEYNCHAPVNVEDIKLGCIQRIAAATETMCKDRVKLEKDLQYERDCKERAYAREYKLGRRVAALKGVITRLKKGVK